MNHNRLQSHLVLGLLAILAYPCSAPLAAADPDVLAAQQRRVEVVRSVASSVVAIFAPGARGGGSGVLISPDGYTVTNFHVVKGLGSFMKCGLNDGRVYDAVIVGIDPTGDVALIQLLGRDDFPHAKIGNSDDVRVGDWAYAMGNPFLLATDFQPTVTYGIISGTHRYQYPAGTFLEYTDCIQIDTSINPGNSGGPLFNDQGELIGINGRGSFEKRGRVNSGAGYAISINQVMNFLDHLKSGRIVDHATLGATVHSGDDGAIYVSNVLERSDAYRRGLRIGDEIVSFAGRNLRSVNQFKNILGIYPKGWKLPLVIRRDGKKQELIVRLMALHQPSELMPKQKPKQKPKRPKPGDHPQPDDKPAPPRRNPHRKPTVKPPEKYKHLFVKKTGFVNWYFNQQHRDQLMSTFDRWGDRPKPASRWTLAGTTQDGAAFQIKINDQAVGILIGDEPALNRADEPFTDAPQGTGGLLAALYQFRHLRTDPEEYFTDFYYLGSEPFLELDQEQRVDVLITTRGTVQTRWYFARDESRLLGWDTTLEEGMDPCEVRLHPLKNFDGWTMPAQFTVRHAGETPLLLTLQSITIEEAE